MYRILCLQPFQPLWDAMVVEIIVSFSTLSPNKAKQINKPQQSGLQLPVPFTGGQVSSYILREDQQVWYHSTYKVLFLERSERLTVAIF